MTFQIILIILFGGLTIRYIKAMLYYYYVKYRNPYGEACESRNVDFIGRNLCE